MNYVDSPFNTPVILSLCPGILGLERGIERAIGPVRVAAYVEIEAFICANLVAAMEAGVLAPAPVWSNVKTFPAKQFHRRVHGIAAGYPCQPFSLAGERKGTDDPRHLWPHIRRIIKAVKPVWCFFENVRGHLSLGYDEVYRDLRALGYSVEPGIFSAEEVGAPHERERLYILAVADTYRKQRRVSEREQGQARQLQGYSAEPERGGEEIYNAIGNGWQQGRSIDRSNDRHQPGAADQYNAMGNTLCNELENPLPARGRCTEPANNECSVSDTQCPHGKEQAAAGQQPEQPKPGEHSRPGQTRWPAPYGAEQYRWEEPRTIKPGMGCTVNGYNFREDFLRALGNSVVEQTAERAFITLLNKFF